MIAILGYKEIEGTNSLFLKTHPPKKVEIRGGSAALAARYASIGRREILATLVQKAVTKPAENNSQFAVWLLK
jgi:hypothetical protein